MAIPTTETIKGWFQEDIDNLKLALELLQKVQTFKQNEGIYKIVAEVAGEIAIREYEVKNAEIYIKRVESVADKHAD